MIIFKVPVVKLFIKSFVTKSEVSPDKGAGWMGRSQLKWLAPAKQLELRCFNSCTMGRARSSSLTTNNVTQQELQQQQMVRD